MTVHSVTVPDVIDAELAQQIRDAANLAATATLERDRFIVEASQAGASLREIARCAGISHVAVMKIIRRDTP